MVRTRGVTGTAEGVVGDRVKGGVAARYHCGTAKVEAIPRIPPLRSFSLSVSPFPEPRRCPLARYATLPPCHPASVFPPLSLSLFLSRLLTPYVRTIANGLQPLPGIYPQNLPERPSNSAASSLAFTLIPPIPQDSSRGSTDCALFKQRDTFPSTTSQFSPGRSPICLAFPG